MSETAAALGVAGSASFGGREYTVSVRTWEMEGLFEVWARKQALDNVLRQEGQVRPGIFKQMLDHWTESAAFAYSWGMPACEFARYSPAGQRYMAWLQLRERHKDVTREQVDAMYADAAFWERMAEFVVGRLDPNPPFVPSEAG